MNDGAPRGAGQAVREIAKSVQITRWILYVSSEYKEIIIIMYFDIFCGASPGNYSSVSVFWMNVMLLNLKNVLFFFLAIKVVELGMVDPLALITGPHTVSIDVLG